MVWVSSSILIFKPYDNKFWARTVILTQFSKKFKCAESKWIEVLMDSFWPEKTKTELINLCCCRWLDELFCKLIKKNWIETRSYHSGLEKGSSRRNTILRKIGSISSLSGSSSPEFTKVLKITFGPRISFFFPLRNHRNFLASKQYPNFKILDPSVFSFLL